MHPPRDAALRVLQLTLDATLEQEEEALFPAIRKCEEAADAGLQPLPGYARAVRILIPVVTGNNDRLASLVEEVLEQRPVTHSPTLVNLAADISSHIHLENEILFPRALRLLV